MAAFHDKKDLGSLIFFLDFFICSSFTLMAKKEWKMERLLLLLCLLILFSEERNNIFNERGIQFDRERVDYERKLNEANAMVSQLLLFFLKSYIHKL